MDWTFHSLSSLQFVRFNSNNVLIALVNTIWPNPPKHIRAVWHRVTHTSFRISPSLFGRVSSACVVRESIRLWWQWQHISENDSLHSTHTHWYTAVVAHATTTVHARTQSTACMHTHTKLFFFPLHSIRISYRLNESIDSRPPYIHTHTHTQPSNVHEREQIEWCTTHSIG